MNEKKTVKKKEENKEIKIIREKRRMFKNKKGDTQKRQRRKTDKET